MESTRQRSLRMSDIVGMERVQMKRTAKGTRRRVARPETEHVRATNVDLATAVVMRTLWRTLRGHRIT
jgi:hypothetical protein